MEKIFLILTLVLTIGSCSHEELDQPLDMKINHYKQYSTSGMRLIYKDRALWHDTIRWSSLDSIKDFEYDWGYDYELKVLKNRDKNGDWGNDEPFYKVHEIISKTDAEKNVTFNILLQAPRRGRSVSVDEILGYRFIDGTKIYCANKCEELAQWFANYDSIVVGTFTHKSLNTIELQNLTSDIKTLYY